MFELEIGQAPAYLTVSATANIYSKEAIQIQYKSVLYFEDDRTDL